MFCSGVCWWFFQERTKMEKGEKVHHQRSKREVWHLTTWPKIQNPHHQLKRFCSGVCWSNDFFRERERRDKVHHQQSKREVCHLTEVRIKNFTVRSAKIVKMFCLDVCLLMFFVCFSPGNIERKKEKRGMGQTDRLTDRKRERGRETETERQSQTDRQTEAEWERQTDREKGRQTDRQIDRETEWGRGWRWENKWMTK